MRVRRPRTLMLAVAVAMTPLVGGCGLLGGAGGAAGPNSTPTEHAAAKSRERVQNYLDAMKLKDVAQGRLQLCAVMQDAFDTAATGPNGDFAKHFTVPQAVITDVRTSGDRQEVGASITVDANGKSVPVDIVFTVARTDGGWCIAGEAPAADALPGGAVASPDPSS
jgi:hypothetical protein